MRYLISLTAVILLLLGFALVCHAQDSNAVPVDVALSNALAQASILKAQLAAAKATLMTQTIVVSNGIAVGTNSTLAPFTPASIGTWVNTLTTLIETLGSIGAAVLILCRSLRKVLPDSWQTGSFGLTLKHGGLEINPQLTPTPPGVAPAVQLKDVKTGAPVEPVAVAPVNPPPKV